MPEIRHRASARARRLTLRISPEGRVSCTRPRGVALAEARAFAEGQGGWIASRLAALPPRVVVGPGAALPVEGRALAVTPAEVVAVAPEAGRLLVPRGACRPGRAIAAWLRGAGPRPARRGLRPARRGAGPDPRRDPPARPPLALGLVLPAGRPDVLLAPGDGPARGAVLRCRP